MVIGKSADQEPVAAGGELTYTINYDNAGASDATNVLIVDTLPAGVTFVSATPFQGSCSETAGVVTCIVGAVSVADPVRQITIVVDVASSLAAGTTLTNTAVITADQVDTNTTNNTATETTGVVGVADMSITKDDAIDPVIAGEEIVYTLQYENLGPSDATNVQVVDALPLDVVFVSAVADNGSCSETAGLVTCDLGTISAGAGIGEIAIVVEVPADAAAGTVTNTVMISTDADDTEPDNDTAIEETTIETSADLSIMKSATPTTVDAGGNVAYTVTYSNAGPSAAVDVVVSDILPPLLTFVSATPSSGTCIESAGTVTCNVGDVSPGSGGTVVIVATVPTGATGGVIANSASVSSTTTDPTPADNTAVAAFQVTPATGPTTTTTTTPSTPTTTPSTPTTVDVDSLPLTGSDMRWLGAIGLGMLLLGTLALARRRAQAE